MSTQVRTTLHLDSDVYQAARSLAAARGQGLGSVISTLARKGLQAQPSGERTRRGFPVFDVASEAKPITTEMVRSALDDE
jgi:hypothetical protein